MDEDKLAAYVDAACALHGLELEWAERKRVLEHFARLASLAQPLLDAPLPAEVEPAPVFEP